MVEYYVKEIHSSYRENILNYIEDSYCSTIPKLLFVFKSVYVQFDTENIIYPLYAEKVVSGKINLDSNSIFLKFKNLEDILLYNHDIISNSSLILKIDDVHIIKKEAV